MVYPLICTIRIAATHQVFTGVSLGALLTCGRLGVIEVGPALFWTAEWCLARWQGFAAESKGPCRPSL